jgi:hypothetical protein
MFYQKYKNKIDEESAFEKINMEKLREEKVINNKTKVLKKDNDLKKKKTTYRKKKSSLQKATTKVTNSALNTIGRKIGNSIIKGLFK